MHAETQISADTNNHPSETIIFLRKDELENDRSRNVL